MCRNNEVTTKLLSAGRDENAKTTTIKYQMQQCHATMEPHNNTRWVCYQWSPGCRARHWLRRRDRHDARRRTGAQQPPAASAPRHNYLQPLLLDHLFALITVLIGMSAFLSPGRNNEMRRCPCGVCWVSGGGSIRIRLRESGLNAEVSKSCHADSYSQAQVWWCSSRMRRE